MNPNAIREKFGDVYIADKRTFTMGIDHRFTAHFAERFKDLNVLETCTGAGFTTISLARTSNSVLTVEINKSNQEQAIDNVKKAGLSTHVSFVHGNILDQGLPYRCIKKMAKEVKSLINIDLTACKRGVIGINQR